jgi:hypothetical protein
VLQISRAARSRNLKETVHAWKQDTGALGLARATVRDAERIMAEPAEGARVYRYLAGCGKTEFLKRLFHYLLLTAFSSSFGIFPAGPIH